MNKKILLVISVIVSLLLCSCKDEGDNEYTKPMWWKLVSTSENIDIKLYKETAHVYCGPEGGTVCLWCDSPGKGLWIYPEAHPFHKENCEYEGSVLRGYKHEWCELKVFRSLMYIEFPPYPTDIEQELVVHVKDDVTGVFGTAKLYVYRCP